MNKFFLDIHCNVKPNSWDAQSENPLTFSAAYYFSLVYKNAYNQVFYSFVFKNKYVSNGNEWRTMENDPNPDWSIDEKISALAYFSFKGDSDWLKKIHIFPAWENSSKWSWFRPDVLAYTLGSKYSWIRPFVAPIVLGKCFLSIREFLNNPQGESSGVQLAFIKLMGWKRLDYIEPYERIWKSAFDIYYPEESHPTRRTWE